MKVREYFDADDRKAGLARMVTQCAQGTIADCKVIEPLGHYAHCASDRYYRMGLRVA